MKRVFLTLGIFSALLLVSTLAVAQARDSTFKASGKSSGYAFGDFAYRGGNDEANCGTTSTNVVHL
jgi:hypothetical protein